MLDVDEHSYWGHALFVFTRKALFICLVEVARQTFDTRLDVDDRKGIRMHFILKGTFRIFVNRGFILRYILDFMVRYVIVKNTYFSELKGESVLYAVLNSR